MTPAHGKSTPPKAKLPDLEPDQAAQPDFGFVGPH